MTALVVHTTTAGGTSRPEPARKCAPSASSVVRRSGPHRSVSAHPAPGPGDGNPTRPTAHPSLWAPPAPGPRLDRDDHQPHRRPGHAPTPSTDHPKDGK